MVPSAWLLVASAHAQPPSEQLVDLEYEIDPAVQDCPSVVEFRSIVARRLGYDPYRAESPLSVRVRVQAAETGLQGAIDWSAGAERPLGERRFDSPNEDCQRMVTTMGFVLAVQIQLMASEPAAEEAPQSEETESATHRDAPPSQPSSQSGRRADAAAPRIRAPKLPPRPESVPARWSAMAGLGPSVGFGLGPNPIAQGRVFVGLQVGQGSIEVDSEASLPSTTRLADATGFTHQLTLGSLAACGLLRSVSACALAKLGRLHVRGIGVNRPASPAGFIALVGPRLAYSLGLGDQLVLMGHADALYLLTPWTVHVNHVPVWTMPRVGAVAGIDLAAQFR